MESSAVLSVWDGATWKRSTWTCPVWLSMVQGTGIFRSKKHLNSAKCVAMMDNKSSEVDN